MRVRLFALLRMQLPDSGPFVVLASCIASARPAVRINGSLHGAVHAASKTSVNRQHRPCVSIAIEYSKLRVVEAAATQYLRSLVRTSSLMACGV